MGKTNNLVVRSNGGARFVFTAVLPRPWLVKPRLRLVFAQPIATAMGRAPDRRPVAPSLRFAILLRLPVEGSPSLANPFSGAKVHRTFAYSRFTLRHHPGSLMKYPG
jgi:hypothetical protein